MKYKLKKDLPDVKAGAIFEYCNKTNSYRCDNSYIDLPEHKMTSDWFAKYLFTTEDNEDLFVGDYCFYVRPDSFKTEVVDEPLEDGTNYKEDFKHFIYFAKEINAEEYLFILKQKIINEAKEKCPIGTKFIPAHIEKSNNQCVIETNEFMFLNNSLYNLTKNGFISDEWQRIVYQYGNWAKTVKDEFKIGDIVVTQTGFIFKIIEITGLNLYFQKEPEWRYWDNDGKCRLANNDEIIKYYENQGWVRGAKFKCNNKIYTFKSMFLNNQIDKKLLVNYEENETIINFYFEDCELIKEPDYPKFWEELKRIEGFCADGDRIIWVQDYVQNNELKDVFATNKQCESIIAFAQLSQLHKAMIDEYNKFNNCDWKPDWNDNEQTKYCILLNKNELKVIPNFTVFRHLSFPTRELAEFSLLHHKKLWEQYYELS